MPLGLSFAANGQITGTADTAGTSRHHRRRCRTRLTPSPPRRCNFTVDTPPPFFSIWSPSTVPGTLDAGADNQVELGVKFKADTDGLINGIRFYKSANNTGTHIGDLWDTSGNLLGTVTFSNETATGWQEADFQTPVAIAANTEYVASYHTTVGHYSLNGSYFANSGVDNPPLHALQNSVQDPNGVFTYDTSSCGPKNALPPCFPNGGNAGNNYWVDVAFSPLALNSVTVTTPVIGSNPSTGTVTLSGAAPSAGLSVALASNNSAVATVPASVMVPAGQTSATFQVSTSTVSVSTQVSITATFQSLTSATLTVTPQLASTTSLSLTSGSNPSMYGTSLTFTATVSGSGPQPAGTVSYYDGGTCSAPGTLLGSGSTLSISTLAAGTHTVLACYSGDNNYTASSASVSQTVLVAATSVSVYPSSITGGSIATGTVTLSGARSDWRSDCYAAKRHPEPGQRSRERYCSRRADSSDFYCYDQHRQQLDQRHDHGNAKWERTNNYHSQSWHRDPADGMVGGIVRQSGDQFAATVSR